MEETTLDLLTAPPTGPIIAAAWGALWGSFLNVVIERLPRGESLMRPASHCMACETPIHWYDNVPLISFLILRGRCRKCGASYSARYFMVELLGLVLSLLCFHHAVTTGTGGAPERLANFLVEFYFTAGLLAILFIDIRTMIIPDAITLPMVAVLPAAAIALGRVHWRDSLLGAVLGFGVVWLLREAWLRFRGEEGIGLGDGKLLAVVAGVLGWQALPVVLLLGSVQGLIVAIPLRLMKRSVVATEAYQGTAVRAVGPETDEPEAETDEPEAKTDEPEAKTDEPEAKTDEPGGEKRDGDAKGDDGEELLYDEIRADAVPFGPFLALAAIECLFLGPRIQQLMMWALDGSTL